MSAIAAVPDKDALMKRLHRIEGQVRGIERMLAADRGCTEVITQIAAASTALESLALVVLDDHVQQCAAQGRSQDLLAAVERFSRWRR